MSTKIHECYSRDRIIKRRTLKRNCTIFSDGNVLEKCSQYWPSSSNSSPTERFSTTSETFGHMEVTTLSQYSDPNLPNTTIRNFYFRGQELAKKLFQSFYNQKAAMVGKDTSLIKPMRCLE